jgi:hypothetical protein
MPQKRSVPRTCETCGSPFLAKACEVAKGWARFCSAKCKGGNPIGHRGNPEERFWAKVDKSPGQGPGGDCWQWTGAANGNGYGNFAITASNHTTAHRYGYEIQNGALEEGMSVLHKCDNPPCVRGSHLFQGTIADNNEDMRRKGRKWTKLSHEQVSAIRSQLAAGMTQQSIADSYGVSQGLIAHINNGRAWLR